ncbi:MAG: squalene/phytoene synthase family protein [Thermoguttaceae bacterium]|nr:squalene/phytoene synthase family protein [Thermoguttaceae bacterium]MDW8078468.1 squalene/phytoene synthase family protein [Thermoguttaceae bacterium]
MVYKRGVNMTRPVRSCSVHTAPALAADLQRYGPLETLRSPVSLPVARRYCAQLARQHLPNFMFLRLVLPRGLQQHLWNIFAFWRWGKDLSIHVHDPRSGLALLDWWHRLLQECYAGQAAHPVFVALKETIETLKIPRDPLADLIAGFRQDQQVTRYYTEEELIAYCRYCHNPLGRLLLYLGECATPPACQVSDYICTGAAWVVFCRDLAMDTRSGRIHLPLARAARFGYQEADFFSEKLNDAFRLFLEAELSTAEGWLRAGASGLPLLPRWLQLIGGIVLGEAVEVIRRIRKRNYDVWSQRPEPPQWEKWLLFARVWWLCRRGKIAALCR